MRSLALASLFAAAVGSVGVVGCAAGSVDGEIDGEYVGGFSNAAFGGGDFDNAVLFSLFASTTGDACETGTELTEGFVKGFSDPDPDERADGIDQAGDALDDGVTDGEWFVFALLGGEDDKDFVDESFELDDLDTGITVTFSVCQKNKIKAADTGLEIDDCYAAREGDLEVNFDEDKGALTVKGEKIEMHDEDDDDVGDIDVNFTFKACEDMADAVADLGD